MRGCGLDSTDSGYDPMVGFSKHSNEPSASIRAKELLCELNDSAKCSWVKHCIWNEESMTLTVARQFAECVSTQFLLIVQSVSFSAYAYCEVMSEILRKCILSFGSESLLMSAFQQAEGY
jgi:hypothetical protein